MNIKEQYPLAYQLIEDKIKLDMSKEGPISEELLKSFPMEAMVNSALKAAKRVCYDLMDQQGLAITLILEEGVWDYKVTQEKGPITGRQAIEQEAYIKALEMLEAKCK